MIWGCFCNDKLGPIAFFDGMVNSNVYISVLQDELLPFFDALHADDISGIVFQQDNARPHTSKITKEFLANSAVQHDFSTMEWPVNSPDMNPIEELWAYFKIELHRRYPDTQTLQGSPAAIRRILRERLMEVWWNISEGVLRNLIDSMLRRVHALIAVKGWYTKY